MKNKRESKGIRAAIKLRKIKLKNIRDMEQAKNLENIRQIRTSSDDISHILWKLFDCRDWEFAYRLTDYWKQNRK